MKGIYSITCTVHNRQYIGSAINLHARKMHHLAALKDNRHANRKLQRAFNKYGIDCFEFKIIEEVEEATNLIAREQFYIDTVNPFYNICRFAGSSLGKKLSKKHIEFLRKISTGRIPSQETRLKMSLASKGKPKSAQMRAKLSASHTGLHLSPETKAKLSASKKGKKMSIEARAKMSVAKKGIPKTPEHNAKNAAAHIGMRPSAETLAKLRGRKLSAEHCAKIAESKRKLWATNQIKRNENGTFLKGIPQDLKQKIN